MFLEVVEVNISVLVFFSWSFEIFSGDFDVLVDDDGNGYIVYSQNYYMSIEQLTPDFYHSTGKSYMFQEYFVEAPIFMKRNNIYYALFGWCCCYCLQGSGILVHTANNPLGPYTLQVFFLF
jgi:hypothetical protein